MNEAMRKDQPLALSVRGLTYAFPGEPPLFDALDFDIREGEFVSLLAAKRHREDNFVPTAGRSAGSFNGNDCCRRVGELGCSCVSSWAISAICRKEIALCLGEPCWIMPLLGWSSWG